MAFRLVFLLLLVFFCIQIVLLVSLPRGILRLCTLSRLGRLLATLLFCLCLQLLGLLQSDTHFG